MKIFSLILVLLTFSLGLQAANICEKEFDKGFLILEERFNWKDFQKFLVRYDHCLDASYAESVQSLAEKKLVNDWRGFTDFVRKNTTNKLFLKNIQGGFSPEMSEKESLKQIQQSARSHCPDVIRSFCKLIKETKI